MLSGMISGTENVHDCKEEYGPGVGGYTCMYKGAPAVGPPRKHPCLRLTMKIVYGMNESGGEALETLRERKAFYPHECQIIAGCCISPELAIMRATNLARTMWNHRRLIGDTDSGGLDTSSR